MSAVPNSISRSTNDHLGFSVFAEDATVPPKRSDPPIFMEKVVNYDIQILDFSTAVQETFKFTNDEKVRLTKFYEFESQDLNETNAVQSAFNFVKGYMQCSDWNYMQKLMSEKTESYLYEHFNMEFTSERLKHKAHALAKFVLNYLVTLNAIYTGQKVRKITEVEWERHKMHEISLEYVIDLAIYGDGTTLGRVELGDVCANYRKNMEDFQSLVDQLYALENYRFPKALEGEYNRVYTHGLSFLKQNFSSPDLKRFSGDTQQVYQKLLCLRQYCQNARDLIGRIKKEVDRA